MSSFPRSPRAVADDLTLTRIYACPSLKPWPGVGGPTLISDTSVHANQLVLDRKLSGVRNPAGVILLQESLFRQAASVTEPEGYGSGYTQWHTWQSSGYPYGTGGPNDGGEYLSNAHEKGGNLVFCDGHVEYRKYERLTNLDFGLLDGNGNIVPWMPSEASSRQAHWPAFRPAFKPGPTEANPSMKTKTMPQLTLILPVLCLAASAGGWRWGEVSAKRTHVFCRNLHVARRHRGIALLCV